MKIAVLGGGHGCYAAAADLAEQGHEVRMWRRDAAAFAPLLATQTITLTKDGYATDTERISVKANGISHHVTLKRGGRRR